MKKNKNSISDIFVKNFSERYGYVPVTRDEILRIWLRSGGSKARVSYAVNVLVNRGILIRVARDLYFHGSIEGLRTAYWDVVQKLVRIHAPSGAILWGEKALEVHMYNYSRPSVLILYTRHTARRIILVDGREIHFRTLVSGKKTRNKNLFWWMQKHSFSHDILKGILIPHKEIALLESLSLRRHNMGIAEWDVFAFLQEYHDNLDTALLRESVTLRYIRALNRLRVIAKHSGYEALYVLCLSVIREEGWWCYVSL